MFAFQLPEPLPLLPLTFDPHAAIASSQITTSDSFLDVDSDDMLSAGDMNHMQSNAPSLRLSERISSLSIPERFFSFGYEYPSERIDLSDLALLKLMGPDSIVRARMPGTDSLYGLSSTSEKHRTCDRDEDARTPDDDDQFNWIWDPDSCVVFGRRYGDPKRKGKSKFCGMAVKATVHLMIHLIHFTSHLLPRLVLSCSVLFCSVLFCSVLFCSVLSCPLLYCPVLSCTVLYCPVLSCFVLSCTPLILSTWCFSSPLIFCLVFLVAPAQVAMTS